MDVDPRREVVARALAAYYGVPHRVEWYGGGPADAVLAALPEYEQVGSRWHDGKQVATYIVREPSTPKVCQACGSDDPKERRWVDDQIKGHPCPDPFHFQGEPEGATP